MSSDTVIPVSADQDNNVLIERKADEGNRHWLISIMADDENQRVDKCTQRKPQIQAVRMELDREKKLKYMVPQVVSLGPCHYHTQELKMEKQKKTAARSFILTCKPLDIHECYEKVKEVLRKARDSYGPEMNERIKDDSDFMRVMFLDGCFAAYFIEKSNQGAIELEVSSRLLQQIVRDMFLLENQVPLAVLRALMKLRFGGDNEAEEQIVKFVTTQTTLTVFRDSDGLPWWLFGFWRSQWYSDLFGSDEDEALHLLDILRRMLLGSTYLAAEAEAEPKPGCLPGQKPLEKVMQSHTSHQFGSVTELKEAGIRFSASLSGQLTSVRFVRNLFFPSILLPEMVVNDATISQMLNLIALERCFDCHSQTTGVTSFLCIMDSLINNAADVKELRGEGILHHGLGSDEDVARVFNELPVDSYGELQVYRNVKERVLSHRSSSVRVSIARWLDTHFSNTWKAISFFAAVVLLLLTAVQTFFSVFPIRK